MNTYRRAVSPALVPNCLSQLAAAKRERHAAQKLFDQKLYEQAEICKRLFGHDPSHPMAVSPPENWADWQRQFNLEKKQLLPFFNSFFESFQHIRRNRRQIMDERVYIWSSLNSRIRKNLEIARLLNEAAEDQEKINRVLQEAMNHKLIAKVFTHKLLEPS